MGEWIIHDTHEKIYRSPFGAVPCCQKIVLRLGVKCLKQVETVVLRIWENKNKARDLEMCYEKTEDMVAYYHIEIEVAELGLHWYYFVITSEGNLSYYGNNNERLGGKGTISNKIPPAFQITVYRQDLVVPTWFAEGVIYQIFVDRFYNGQAEGKIENPKKGCLLHGRWDDTPCYLREADGSIQRWNFFGGNLQGVIEKLPYLKELGVSVLYLNPIFESASNHKYDTADYKKIDPMFGDNEIFKELCVKAKALNIQIILDGVFSHTGADSIYFNMDGNYPEVGAYQSKKSPYYSWYRFKKFPDEYESWWGSGTLPNVNEMESSYREFILHGPDSVIKYWLELGAAGWRLDVADELPDEFIKEMRQVMKDVNPDSILLGEVWEDASNKVSYGENRQYLWGEELDTVMNYPFRKSLLDFVLGYISANLMHARLMSLYENYPRAHFYSSMNLIGSHDVPRVLTLLGEAPLSNTLGERERESFRLNSQQRQLGLARLKLLVLFQMTFPGVPAIYYGDEVGMEGYTDPYNRGTYPWGREDTGLLTYYQRAVSLRNNFIALQKGDWAPCWVKGDVYGFLRIYQEEVSLVLLNRHQTEEQQITLTLAQEHQGLWQEVFPQENAQQKINGMWKITLRPLEGKVLIKVK